MRSIVPAQLPIGSKGYKIALPRKVVANMSWHRSVRFGIASIMIPLNSVSPSIGFPVCAC
jgi:hypothetical protein